MLITVTCPACARRYDVAGKLAGKRVRCKECANVFRMPVPQTMPKPERRRRRKPSIESGSIEEWLEPAADAAAPAPPSSVRADGWLPDWGATWTYRPVQAAVLAVLLAVWFLRLGSPLRIAVWLLLIAGLFGLLPILGGWPSFEESRRTRLLARVVGPEGAKVTQATAALALWILAILIGLGAIHSAALDPPPETAESVRQE